MSKIVLLGIGRNSHTETKGNVTIHMQYVAGGSFANITVREDGKRVFSRTDMNSWTIARLFAEKREEYGF